MMKKKILKAGAFLLALALIIGVCWFANGLVGNPFSKMAAANTAKKHLEEKYGDTDFEIERVMFNFKNGCYNAFIVSPSSMDSHFNLVINGWGKLLTDSYEDRVLARGNTAERIRRDYRSKVEAVLSSPAFPYDDNIGYGDIEFIARAYKDAPDVPSYAIVSDDLALDALYDANELGKAAGKLTLYIDDDTVSVERLCEILLDIRRIFEGAGVRFYAIDCVLEYPKSEDGTEKEGRAEVMDFLCSDIYEEGMLERVRAADEAAKAYYAEQDAKK